MFRLVPGNSDIVPVQKERRRGQPGMAVPLKPTWDHGTKFRLLPGISDIAPLQREKRRGQPRMAVLLKPTWDHGRKPNGCNKLAGGADYLAGGGPCIATGAGNSSPLGGKNARKCGRGYCPAGPRP